LWRAVKIFVASDHAGFHLKQKVVAHLRAHKHEVEDLGPQSVERIDYPDFAAPVSRAVRDTAGAVGVLVCGSGVGMCISANKVHGIRAVDAFSMESTRLSRSHNDANVLCLGERLIPPDTALAMVDAFLQTPFDGGRHQTRVDKIHELETAEAATSTLHKSARKTP
jgi:ribose 5-phosphate isomerase B